MGWDNSTILRDENIELYFEMGVNVHSACLIKFDSCLLGFDTSFRRKFFICSWVQKFISSRISRL